MWLLDTNVISEIRHPQGDCEVKKRIAALPGETLFLSAIGFGELVKGVCRLPATGRKSDLENWLTRLEAIYGDRILAFDREAARIWGRIVAESESEGRILGMADGQIAATAIRHGFTLVTRNTRHFDIPRLELWNPWESEASK